MSFGLDFRFWTKNQNPYFKPNVYTSLILKFRRFFSHILSFINDIINILKF